MLHLLSIFLIILSGSAIAITPIAIIAVTTQTTQIQSSSIGTLLMDKLSTTATQTTPGCYKGFVNMNITWTLSNNTYPVNVQDFFIVIGVANQVVSNSTLTSYISPSNKIQTLLIFPNLPVTFQVSFQNVCGTPSTFRLVYIDTNFHFIFNLP